MTRYEKLSFSGKNRRLPAEWEEQDAVLVAWPHEATDWLPMLEAVERVYCDIARAVTRFEPLWVVAPDVGVVSRRLERAGVPPERVRLFEIATNDTWARDYGPLTVFDDGGRRMLDFGFNGWGLKYVACHDNRVTRRLHALGAFGGSSLETVGLVLEGGSIESDGAGTLLTTSQCLLGPNRNPHLSKDALASELRRHLGVDHLLWLDHGHLAGDDTDSHVDTLARLCPDDTILYVACDDPADVHHAELAAMADELANLRTRDGRPFRLIPLPWPKPVYDGEKRLPATHANFLVVNGAVLVPVYGDPGDAGALAAVGEAFPDREIVGIDCLPLLFNYGSLHCVTMQIPGGGPA